MKNNLFSFATKELSQDAFLCWCWNWYNEPEAPLYSMAKDLMALFGETDLPDKLSLKIYQQWKKIDILLILPELNRVLIIEDKISSQEHDQQIARYREQIQNITEQERESLGIKSDPTIRTIYFKTGFYYDCDRETVADVKIDGNTFFETLEKYKNKSEILDSYLAYLQGSLAWYEEYGQYAEKDFNSDFWCWNIVNYHIAQHNFMQDLFRDKLPESMWVPGDERYKIQQGANIGGRPWTELTFLINTYPNSEDSFYLFWRVDTDGNGPYLSLRFYEKFAKNDQEKKERHIQAYTALRQAVEQMLNERQELALDWDSVKGGYTGGYYESRILTINLFDVLRDWKQKKDLLALQVNTITDFYLKLKVNF